MTTIQNLFQQAQLAEAAYAKFMSDAGVLLTSDRDVKGALQDKENSMSFSGAQAADFANHWRVIDQVPDTIAGFSATVFQNTDTNKYTLAIQGSNGLNDFNIDGALIAKDGIAISQVVDLYNYWKRLNTPHGEVYDAMRLVPVDANTPNTTPMVWDSTMGGWVAIQPVKSNLLADATLRTGSGTFATPPASLDVTGHSLGGHLAMAFTRLFPSVASNTISVNGLGFKLTNSNVTDLFAALNGAPVFNPMQIQNVYGIAGPEFAAMNNWVLQQPCGSDRWNGILIESASPLSPIYGGHGASQMTDSLAIYNLLATLDPSLSEATADNLNKMSGLLKASSYVAANSLESTLDALRTVLRANCALGSPNRRKRKAANDVACAMQRKAA